MPTRFASELRLLLPVLIAAQLATAACSTDSKTQGGSPSNGRGEPKSLPGTTFNGTNLCERPYDRQYIDSIRQTWGQSEDGSVWRHISSYEHILGNVYCPPRDGHKWEFAWHAGSHPNTVLPEFITLHYADSDAVPGGRSFQARRWPDGYYRVDIDDGVMKDWATLKGFRFTVRMNGISIVFAKEIFGLPVFQQVPIHQQVEPVILHDPSGALQPVAASAHRPQPGIEMVGAASNVSLVWYEHGIRLEWSRARLPENMMQSIAPGSRVRLSVLMHGSYVNVQRSDLWPQLQLQSGVSGEQTFVLFPAEPRTDGLVEFVSDVLPPDIGIRNGRPWLSVSLPSERAERAVVAASFTSVTDATAPVAAIPPAAPAIVGVQPTQPATAEAKTGVDWVESSPTALPLWRLGWQPASNTGEGFSFSNRPDGGVDLRLVDSTKISMYREFSLDDLLNRGIDLDSDLEVIPNLSGIDWSIVSEVGIELLTESGLHRDVRLYGPGTQSDDFRIHIAASTLAEWRQHSGLLTLRYIVRLDPQLFRGQVGVYDPVFWQEGFLEQAAELAITDMSPGIVIGTSGEVHRTEVNEWRIQYGLSSRDDTSVPVQVAPFGPEVEYGFTLENPNQSSFAAQTNVTNLIQEAREAGVKHPELQVDLQVGGSHLDRSNVFLRLYRDGVSIAEVPLLTDGQFSIPIPADSLAEQLDTLLAPGERPQLDLSIWALHDANVESLTVKSVRVVEGEPPPTVGERIVEEAKSAIGEDTLTRIERTMAITSQKEFQILCKLALAAGMLSLLYAAWRYLQVYPTNRWLRDALVDLDSKGPEFILDEIEKKFGSSEFKYDRVLIEVVNYLKLAVETNEFENQVVTDSSLRKFDQLSQALHLVLTTKPEHHRDLQLRTELVMQWQATTVQLAKRCEQNAQLKPQLDHLLRGLSSQASPLMHNLVNGDVEFAKLAHRYL